MRTKTKNFFEDLFILLILAIIIFFVYFFFFCDDEKPQILGQQFFQGQQEKFVENSINEPNINDIENRTEQTNISTQNQEIVQPKILETENSSLNEIKEEPKEQANTKTQPITETPKTDEVSINREIKEIESNSFDTQVQHETQIVETNSSNSQLQDIQTNENENKDENEIITIDQFFKNFEKKVYENIDRNVDKSTLRSGQFVNIKVTFLKDGNFEQLTYVSGNIGYFNLIKSSIEEAFPILINDSIKSNFPRYYRMKIEF